MLGQPPHFLVKQQNPEPITGIQKVEGEAAELSVIKETLNDLIEKLSTVFSRPGNTVSEFNTQNLAIALNGNFQDIATLNITTTALGYIYGNANILWHPQQNQIATVEFKFIIDGETDIIVSTHTAGDSVISSFQYRTSVKVNPGTYPVTMQARQTSGPLVTVQHTDLFALGNLQ